jgi:glucose-6-phosphate isomerase
VPVERVDRHLVAITATPAESARQGYAADRTFLFWDWVGGRYSVWSALGLPLAIAIGGAAFRAFLAGARAMDAHFCSAPMAQNLPMQMALYGIWNRNFLRCPTQLIVSYASRLVRFVPFVQQMDMESNGKRTHIDGQPVDVDTGPIVWGGLGIDGQHAYFQLIHQGRHTRAGGLHRRRKRRHPAAHGRHPPPCGQPEPARPGRGHGPRPRLRRHPGAHAETGLSGEQAEAMARHRMFEGNIPSSILWLDRLDPARLGALIAAYEHKVFTQAAIWRINAYDQWGVELGKTMAKAMEMSLPPKGAEFSLGRPSAEFMTPTLRRCAGRCPPRGHEFSLGRPGAEFMPHAPPLTP